ncbi:hypothetical protein [Flavilitoribacter nigricans]|uniref:Uncharacterized protein n=1 Tax=Flavilitoribacter nigricans (strain ATCC 23147 / DSM 23189 / NBRC 102662 / NCIMB 1420 / SS-2) TaxID=1122177 RepID=A0A2D0MZL0_FLAN2|nr:hypothetical protein [Flavilitoribacter nigricans]PHN01657.1 hypothetical protein CRP01_36175 [Flavilitoribacter nigricans DSM 23189 = NBRC 102662]
MKKSALILCLLLYTCVLSAQTLIGNYITPGSNGGLSLELERNIGGVQGYLKDAQGHRYFIQAEEENGIAFGTISMDQGAMFLRMVRQGSQLYLSLLPVGANGQADTNNAQEFVLTAADEKGNPIYSAPSATPRAYDQPTAKAPRNPNPPPAGKWDGFFSGRVMDRPSTMNLQLAGTQLSGDMNVDGYRYTISGTINGYQSRGRMLDLQTNDYFNYTANLDGKQINLNIENPINGSSQLVIFKRGTGTVLNPNPPFNARPYEDVQFTQREQHDNRITGRWYFSESIKAGSYFVSKQWKFILNADGSYIFGDARVIGVAPENGSRGYGGDINYGKWRTENNILYVDSGAGWEAYAYYARTGDDLLLDFGNDTRQLWVRTN